MTEKDAATLVRVAEGDRELGQFYLSRVELYLKEGSFRSDFWGWVDGSEEWLPLGDLAKLVREKIGKKVLASSSQRALLKKIEAPMWRGISNREASVYISKSIESNVPLPGDWNDDPATESQKSYLADLGISFDQYITKREVGELIESSGKK